MGKDNTIIRALGQQAQPNENYYFVHDENGNVLCDIDKEGNIKANYVYVNGKHIAKIEGSNRYYYHLNPVGSPLVITMEEGPLARIVKQYKYRAFVELKYESGTYYDNHKFTGKEEDGSGLYYFGARYYDKSIGRWISPDPASYPSDLNLNDPQTSNPYVYCTNNPLKYIDPNGLWRTGTDEYRHPYITQQTMPAAITEFGVSLVPGGELAITSYRFLTDDITITKSDWVSAGIGAIPIPGTSVASKAIRGLITAGTAAHSLGNIQEAWQDKTKMAIFSKLSQGSQGQLNFPLFGSRGYPATNEDITKMKDIDAFYKAMVDAGWQFGNLSSYYQERFDLINKAWEQVKLERENQ